MTFIIGAPKSASTAPRIGSDTDGASFQRNVLEASAHKPVVAVFHLATDPGCRAFVSDVEAVVRDYGDSLALVRADVADKLNAALVQRLGMRGVPALFAFDNGRPVDGFAGALPARELKVFFEGLFGAPALSVEALLAEAQALFAAGDYAAAAQRADAVLQADPAQLKALGLRIECALCLNDGKRAETLLQSLTPAQNESDPIRRARVRLAFMQRTDSLQLVGVYAEQRRCNPNDVEATVNYALCIARAGNLSEAIETLLQVACLPDARAQVVPVLHELFTVAGLDSPISRDGRKRLSALLFA